MRDFAMEPDEEVVRKAAHLMVSSLAGSLALVTCREPLRTHMLSGLLDMLKQNFPAATPREWEQAAGVSGPSVRCLP